MTAPPPDQVQRRRIGQDLGSTLFVEAGAGSGKTTALVDRIVALVASGTAELESIAAVTFAESAAAELRDRVRRQLEEQAAEAGDATVAERCQVAVDQLDGAAIGTLHAFARRLLGEHPVEVGLPPRFDVLDEVGSDIEFERRWTSFLDELLADSALERTLLLLTASGVKPTALRVLAAQFDQNWDLVETHVGEDEPEPPPVAEVLAPVLAEIEAVCEVRWGCRDEDDKLCQRLEEIAELVTHLREMDDEVDLLDQLQRAKDTNRPSFKVGNCGRAGNWDGSVNEVRGRVAAAAEALYEVAEEVANACARRVGSALRRFTLAAAAERRSAGQLDFHDLLVLARSLLCHPHHGAAVRERLHRRYRFLLLDEFQDTDPIQIDLAVRIAAQEPASAAAGAAPWCDVAVTPGQLFVVGDPKQSIYRFRRADIATFLDARRRYGAGGGSVELSANFRSGAPLIDWVNHTFDELFGADAEAEVPVPSQPDYLPLEATRPAGPTGPPVAVVGRQGLSPEMKAPEQRSVEAEAVAAAVARAVAEGWSVATGDAADPWRPADLADITILVPARTSLPFLEDALDAAGVPYRAESSSLVYASRTVRDLMLALRAVEDPTDHLRVVAALRSPLFACGDDDLFRFKVERRGRWNYLADQPDTVPAGDPVAAGLAYLRRLHDERRWMSPSELLDRIARDRRAFELGGAEGRARDVWRRLRYVIDQARAWSETGATGLRRYRQWIERQTADGARVAEAVLPETDDDAVRIMTVHAAKGLEFPIAILSGMSTRPQSGWVPADVAFLPDGKVGYRFGKHVTTAEFSQWQPVDEQMACDERIRLLYVACTRARDHLVVSLHRKERSNSPKDLKSLTNAELLVRGMGGLVDDLPDAADQAAERPPITPPAPPEPPPPFARWEAELAAAMRAAAHPSTVAATALTDEGTADPGDPVGPDGDLDAAEEADDPAAGLQKRPRDLDLPPWLKGRYGTAVGRAVHGVLQTVDLATGAELGHHVAAQCEAEAIPTRRADVTRLVEAALASPVVRAAAARPHWREVYSCVPLAGGRLLEGYVDLLYRDDDGGLVVVDYKTAATSDPGDLARRAGGYRLQGAAYALSVGRTTGAPVTRVTFLFLTPAGAVEHDLDDVDAAASEVETLVAQGQEVILM